MSLSNRYKIISSYLKREEISAGMPLEVTAELTNICNLRCGLCPQTCMKRERGFIDESVFQKIVDECAKDTELFYLHMGGESLLHPKCADFMKYSYERGVFTALSTNAVSMTEDLSEKIIKSGLDWLVISLDAAQADTYLRIKGVDRYQQVFKNLKTFLEIRGKSKKPYVTAQMLISDQSIEEKNTFKEIWTSAGADTIRMKPLANFGGQVDIGGDERVRDRACFLLWRQIAFTWEGQAALCCFDIVDPQRLGSIEEASLKDIWNGPGFRAWRKKHIECQFSKEDICYTCNVMTPSTPAVIGSVLLDGAKLKKVLAYLERLPGFRWNEKS